MTTVADCPNREPHETHLWNPDPMMRTDKRCPGRPVTADDTAREALVRVLGVWLPGWFHRELGSRCDHVRTMNGTPIVPPCENWADSLTTHLAEALLPVVRAAKGEALREAARDWPGLLNAPPVQWWLEDRAETLEMAALGGGGLRGDSAPVTGPRSDEQASPRVVGPGSDGEGVQ